LTQVDCLERALLGGHLNNFIEALVVLDFLLSSFFDQPLSSYHASYHSFLALLVLPLLVDLAEFFKYFLAKLRHLLKIFKAVSEFSLEANITVQLFTGFSCRIEVSLRVSIRLVHIV
jgi:uncharacterized membrane protein